MHNRCNLSFPSWLKGIVRFGYGLIFNELLQAFHSFVPPTVETISYITSYYIYIHSKALKKRRINFPTTNVLGKSIQMNKKVQMQTKGGFTYKILCCVWFFHYLCGNPELPCFNTWKNLDINSYRKWITYLYLTFIPSSDIWDRPTSFFLNVFFVILCKKLIENRRALGCQLQTGRYMAKLLCCHV